MGTVGVVFPKSPRAEKPTMGRVKTLQFESGGSPQL